MIAGVCSTNNWQSFLVCDKESICQAAGCFWYSDTIQVEFSIQSFSNGSGRCWWPRNDKSVEIQTNLADVFIAFANFGWTSTNQTGWGFKICGILCCARSTSESNYWEWNNLCDIALSKPNKRYLQVQHTPNPSAQDPALVPPKLEHSSLKAKEFEYFYSEIFR